jgi:hypothetical protein
MTGWNLPHCSGAIDGKHINIRCPRRSYSEFYNYKGTCGNYCFRYIDIGRNGRASDSTIFRESTLSLSMENNELNLRPNAVIVGDDAFPLRTNLLKAYSRVNLTLK